MRRSLIILSLLLASLVSSAQVYVLKDHRDSFPADLIYDSLPTLCDSFYSKMRFQDVGIIKQFSPTLDYLKSSIDTVASGLKESDLIYRQKFIQQNLEKTYSKILKKAAKDNIRFKHYTLDKKQFQFGKTEDGNDFCYVTLKCSKKTKTLEVRFLAMKFNGAWFMVDELSIVWL